MYFPSVRNRRSLLLFQFALPLIIYKVRWICRNSFFSLTYNGATNKNSLCVIHLPLLLAANHDSCVSSFRYRCWHSRRTVYTKKWEWTHPTNAAPNAIFEKPSHSHTRCDIGSAILFAVGDMKLWTKPFALIGFWEKRNVFQWIVCKPWIELNSNVSELFNENPRTSRFLLFTFWIQRRVSKISVFDFNSFSSIFLQSNYARWLISPSTMHPKLDIWKTNALPFDNHDQERFIISMSRINWWLNIGDFDLVEARTFTINYPPICAVQKRENSHPKQRMMKWKYRFCSPNIS